MGVGDLLAWQWSGYPKYHATRANLLLHVVAVPLFLLGNVTLVFGMLRLALVPILTGAAAMAVGLALQGSGYKRESVPPEPFSGPANAVARLLLEQWVTFPRFLLSGNWARAFRGET